MSTLALVCLTAGTMLFVEIVRRVAPNRPGRGEGSGGAGFEGTWFGSDCDGGDGGGD